jgi:hypothetical protein
MHNAAGMKGENKENETEDGENAKRRKVGSEDKWKRKSRRE